MVIQHQEYTDLTKVPFTHRVHIGMGAVGVVGEVIGTTGQFQDKIYARKIITLVDNAQSRKAGLREIEKEVNVLRNVQHEHIIRLVMANLFRNNYAIIMDPLADQNLEQYFQIANKADGEGRQTRQQNPQWFECLISGIAYIHERGIRHRDIKPSNILIKDRDILFTDFGISIMGLEKTIPTTIPDRPRARTREYCAPEVENGHTRGISADIFSLGAVFLEMLTIHAWPRKAYSRQTSCSIFHAITTVSFAD